MNINEDNILTEFLRSLGPWRDHIILGGGYALIIYKLYLAQKEGPPPVPPRSRISNTALSLSSSVPL